METKCFFCGKENDHLHPGWCLEWVNTEYALAPSSAPYYHRSQQLLVCLECHTKSYETGRLVKVTKDRSRGKDRIVTATFSFH